MKSFASQPQKPIKKADYVVQETQFGTWSTQLDERGNVYREFRSHTEIFDLPLVSLVSGFEPNTRRLGTAHGILAIGNKAKGVIAIGQFCQGYISIGQFVTARVFGIGQFTVAPIGIGQLTIAVAAISQIGAGMFGIHQTGATLFGGIGQAMFSLF